MGPPFESPPGPLLTSDMWPLDRYGTHQKTISRRPEQMYSPSDRVGNGLERVIIYVGLEYTPRGQTATTIQIISWAIIEIRHGALGQI